MATNKPNTALRIVIPLALAGVAVVAAWAVMVNTSRTTPAPTQQAAASTPVQAETGESGAAASLEPALTPNPLRYDTIARPKPTANACTRMPAHRAATK